MELNANCINARNWVDSAQDRDYLESSSVCGIEPQSYIGLNPLCIKELTRTTEDKERLYTTLL